MFHLVGLELEIGTSFYFLLGESLRQFSPQQVKLGVQQPFKTWIG